MDSTKSDPPARVLDLTRLVSRAGCRDTGIDRVERAYLGHLLRGPVPLYGLVATSLGFLLLDRDGCGTVQDSGPRPPARLFDRLARRGNPARAALEGALRRRALARCRTARLGHTLRQHLPRGTSYLNIGHTNLTHAVLDAFDHIAQRRIGVFVHDTIPLDLPELQKPGTVPRFRAFLDRALARADVILANSDATVADIARHAPGPVPGCETVPLGVDTPCPGPAPAGPWRSPYFVALGTIEPRKNHAFLLDLWDDLVAEMGDTAPHLLILGQRGWNNTAVFARLDRSPPHVHERNGLPDAEVFALLAASAGLLLPSRAEGFGLPAVEAAALGVPVVLNDLPVFHETLGDIPIYAPIADRYPWRATIKRLTEDHRAGETAHGRPFQPPTWDAHFKTVLMHL